jgi:exopolyphosphatase/guanosine-5'-triphosphate,3'-diphosphate pyrophosphatase
MGDEGELGRWAQVTGLGRGVDRTGALDADAIERTISVLSEYGDAMRFHEVERRRAVATSASRDASNREHFLDLAERALGVRPELVSGAEEAELSYRGATGGVTGPGPFVVSDIGGGSTEFVTESEGQIEGISIDIGSVRLTERVLGHRPAAFDEIEAAAAHVRDLFAEVPVDERSPTVIGVAGTWTSAAAIALGLERYDRNKVHGARLERLDVDRVLLRLAPLTTSETERIPALDPARAPVILAGIVVAREVLRHMGASSVVVSECDLLDGIAATL